MSWKSLILLAVALVAVTANETSAQGRPSDLKLATLEELMNIEVTSASRREQRVEDVPASVYVIGRDEIRRSGMTSIPDLLRLAPGVQVAQINSNKWAVSVRGFNSLYSNKLLVMVDGRSIYNPAFSTVLWDTEDLMIEDIDHIEVIRGPGGAMWGANAVNGVINIITKPSAETRGGLIRVSAGTFDTTNAALRYGGARGATTYRVYAQASAHGRSEFADGARANDDWHSVTSGARADRVNAHGSLMIEGSATTGRQRPLWLDVNPLSSGQSNFTAVSETTVGHVLGRWTHAPSNGSSFQLQSFFDAGHREEAIGVYDRHTWDVDAQYHVTFARRHELVTGGGLRYIVEAIDGRGGYVFTPNRARPVVTNAFAQDTIAFAADRVELTIGAKFENNSFAGSGFQPNTRVLWKVAPRQRVWASAARALRTPSLIDRGLRLEYPSTPLPNGLPLIVGALGNPDFESEHLINAEAGYRLNVGSVASFDVVGFSGRYDDLQTREPLEPALEVVNGRPQLRALAITQNVLRADTAGAEVTARLQVSAAWQIDGTFSAFHLTPHPNGSLDPSSADYDGRAPRTQWRAHSAFSVGPRSQADVHLFRVGEIRGLGVQPYTRLDARVEWALTGQLSVILAGQNMLDASHGEFFGYETNIQSTLVPRNIDLRLAWRF